MVLYENFNTTNQTVSVYAAHESFVGPIELPTCRLVEGLPHSQKCHFVKHSGLCHLNKQFVNYVYLQFCLFTAQDSDLLTMLSYIINFVICIYYFFILANAADRFFTPSLSMLGKLLRLNENIAGLTLLAIGNSSPDFLYSVMAIHKDNPILYSQTMGSALFVTTFLGGIIICMKPFKLNSFVFLRDALFLLMSVLLLEIIMRPDYVVAAGESIFIPMVYLAYIAIVFLDYHYAKISGLALEMQLIENKKQKHIVNFQLKDNFQNILFDCVNHLKTFKIEEWKRSQLLGRFLILFNMPILFGLKLLIPIVDDYLPKDGWCKLLNSIQLSTLPLVMYLVFCHPVSVNGVNILYFMVPILLGFSALVFLTTRVNHMPRFHKLLIIYCITGSIFVIYVVAHELSHLIDLIAIVLRLSPSLVGCTLLTWGNCVGELMADLALTKRGYQEMAYSATFGSPMFSILFQWANKIGANHPLTPIFNSLLLDFIDILVSLSVDLMYKSFMSPNKHIKVATGSLSVNCTIFLLIGLCLLIVGALLTNFIARRSLGLFLIIFYFIFLFGTFAAHSEFIHAYGTNHNIDFRFQDGETKVSFFN